MIHILHKWRWHWDDHPGSVYSIVTKKRLIQIATGWWECDKCHKIDRKSNCKTWWDR